MNFCAALFLVLSVVTKAKEYSDESLSFSDQAKPSSCVASIPVFFKTSFLSLLNYSANQCLGEPLLMQMDAKIE